MIDLVRSLPLQACHERTPSRPSGTTGTPLLSTSRACCSTAPICSAPTSGSPISAAATRPPRWRRRTRSPASAVTVLWVKGSGGDLGSMALDGFATLYLDKLESLKRIYRGLAHEDEMVGGARPLHFRSQPAPALGRHLPARLRALCPCRSRPFRRRDRDRRGQGPGAPDPRGLRRRDRLPALAAPRHRPRHQARRDGKGEPRLCRRRARLARPVHLGEYRQGLLRGDDSHHQQGGSLARRARRAGRPSAARRSPRCPRPSEGPSPLVSSRRSAAAFRPAA